MTQYYPLGSTYNNRSSRYHDERRISSEPQMDSFYDSLSRINIHGTVNVYCNNAIPVPIPVSQSTGPYIEEEFIHRNPRHSHSQSTSTTFIRSPVPDSIPGGIPQWEYVDLGAPQDREIRRSRSRVRVETSSSSSSRRHRGRDNEPVFEYTYTVPHLPSRHLRSHHVRFDESESPPPIHRRRHHHHHREVIEPITSFEYSEPTPIRRERVNTFEYSEPVRPSRRESIFEYLEPIGRGRTERRDRRVNHVRVRLDESESPPPPLYRRHRGRDMSFSRLPRRESRTPHSRQYFTDDEGDLF